MIELIIVIALMGLAVWAVTTLIPMPPPFAKAIYVIAVVLLVIYLLRFFGYAFGGGPIHHHHPLFSG